MSQYSPKKDLKLPNQPTPGFLLADRRTESTFEEIPVIDFKAATSNDPRARRELADLIRDACINVGFFYLKNHGIPQELIDKTVEAGKRFFTLPDEEKMKLDIHKSSNYKGYTALLGENTNAEGLGDLHEGFDIGWEPESEPNQDTQSMVREDGAMTGGNVWPNPKDLPGFRKAFLAYYHSVIKLGKLLFPIFALALDLPETFFDDKTTKPAAIMRLLHYPPQSPTKLDAQDDRQIGIGSHTDYECFTILWQDSAGGLQVQNASGKWIDAIPVAGTVVVNLGDQFSRWTNDVFKSTVHRVINRSGLERYSIPLFFGTDYEVLLEPIPTCVSPGTPIKYEVVTAGEYVRSRLEATYGHSTS
ncbi:Clavaminate synthase-like protein [Macrolepiota fuliginosa MF-IS2]|uniref:Clavaminate synthase-like protein n=1 Tax=Macrolepiota fuliginosa MF-IS2 TaxID=1400762 RepID=A0A9P5XLR1_9AGAR|nr:Clavaminate synthase-like protein [Macrolepiota fuliginosa MF-IS2]